jgi:hypothetical protein
MTYFRKKFLGALLQDDKIFVALSQKGYGGENFFSMLVQGSLPILQNVRVC